MDENEMKALENRLRSWRPRRASATLNWRLFLASARGVPRMIRVAGWLTPATACLLLAVIGVDSENAGSTGGTRAPSLFAMMSNQSYAVYMTSRQSEQNNLSAFTFDLTNRSGSGSNLSFTPFRKQTD